MKKMILSLPHGFRRMALSEAVVPTITKSSYECNNLLVEYMEGINVLLTPEERKSIIKRVRIRKLTPKECLRLMGVSDMDIMKMRMYPYHELVKSPSYSKEEILMGMTEDEKRSLMQKGISNSQLYKLAGNSIVVPVLEGIFTQLFREDNECLF